MPSFRSRPIAMLAAITAAALTSLGVISIEPALAEATAPAAAFSVSDFAPDPDQEPISRTEDSNTYDAGDGVMVTEVASVPLNVQDDDGEWVPIDASVSEEPSGTLVAEGTPLAPVFSQDAGSKMLSVSDGEYSLSFGLVGAADSEAEIASSSEDQSVVTYENATATGEDVEYKVSADSVKETIVLPTAPASGSPSWKWKVQAPGLTLQISEFGDLKFKDSSGTTRFSIPAPRMWDSSGEDGVREPQEHPVAVTFAKTSPGAWDLTLTADGSWLRSSDRVFPVFVDPTTSLGDSSVVAYKSDGATRTDAVHVGNSRDGNTNKYWRSRVTYNYSSLYGKQVLDATLSVSYASGTTTTQSGSVYTVSGSGYSGVGSSLGGYSVSSGSGSTAASNTALPNKLADLIDAHSLQPLMVRGAETAGSYTYKQLNTTLKIAWKPFVTLTVPATTVSPTDGAILNPQSNSVSDIQPSFAATIVDSGGVSPKIRYSFYASATATQPLFSTPWTTDPVTTLSLSALSPSTQYFWRVQGTDEYDGLYGTSAIVTSSARSFTTDADPSPTLDAPTVGPIVMDPDAGAVTVPQPSIAAYADFAGHLAVRYDGEVWSTDPTPSLVAQCSNPYVYSGEFNSCDITTSLPAGTYQARLKASSTNTTGSWSNWTTFTVIDRAPSGEFVPTTGQELMSGALDLESTSPADIPLSLLIDGAPASDDLGAPIPTPIISTTESDANGNFVFKVSDTSLLDQATDGQLNVRVVGQASGESIDFSGTLVLGDPSNGYAGSYFTNSGVDAPPPVIEVPSTPRAAHDVGPRNVPDYVAGTAWPGDSEYVATDPIEFDDPTLQGAMPVTVDSSKPLTAPSQIIPTSAAGSGIPVCVDTVLKTFKVPTQLGATWDESGGATKEFKYTQNGKTTLGTAVSLSGKAGSFSAGGTVKLSNSSETGGDMTWSIKPTTGRWGFVTNTRYAKVKTNCYSDSLLFQVWTKYSYKPVAITPTRTVTSSPGSTPIVNKSQCDWQRNDGGSVSTTTGSGGSFSGGVDISAVIGFDLSAQTDWSSSVRLTYKNITTAQWLCGTNGSIWEGGKIISKKNSTWTH